MHINVLSDEILVEIFSYLELEDVLSCSLVCKSWRNALNTNVIWFNLCSRRSPVSRNNVELLQAPSIVEPQFTSPTQTSPRLPEVCPWRLKFMQGAHLSRNWRSGRFVDYHFGRNPSTYFECGEDNDVIYVMIDNGEGFSRYCINSRPNLLQTKRFSLKDAPVHFFKLAGEKLVVGQYTLMQVFSKTKDEMFEMSHRFLFNKSESEYNNMPDSPDINEWYRTNIGIHSPDSDYFFDCNEDCFVGLLPEGNLNKAVLHIWDLNRRQKTKEICVPDISYQVVGIEYCIHSSSLYILMSVRDRRNVIRCLSLNTFKYTDLDVQFTSNVPSLLVCDKFFLIVENCGNNVWIWSVESGSLVHKLSCDFDINLFEFASDLLILAGNRRFGRSGTVKVFNTSSLKYTCEFATDYIIDNLFYICSGLILVCGLEKSEIWDIASVTKLRELEYEECIWISPAKTKMLVKNGDELILLHFW